MEITSDFNNSYADASQIKADKSIDFEKAYTSNNDKVEEMKETAIHNAAVTISISLESIKAYLNIKSVELSQSTSSAQNTLFNLANNEEIYSLLSGQESEGGLSLSSLGYSGKAITELNPGEARDLISEDGFFGVDSTSKRVASFVFNISENNLENLQDSRKGLVEGFEAAEKLWGGKLPDISYETQKRTLEIVDDRIAELMKTDAQKDLDKVNKR